MDRRTWMTTTMGIAALGRAEQSTTQRRIIVRADGAQKVRFLSPDMPEPIDMNPTAPGTFEAHLTLDVRPNRYRYRLEVDGKEQADGANPLMVANGGKLESGNLVWHPEPLHQDWLQNRIPRGQLQRMVIRCSHPRPHDCQVWSHVPAGYEGRTKGLPALYLLHAGGGSGLGFAQGMAATEVADWLISQRRVRPFVLVMPDREVPPGYSTPGPREASRDEWVKGHIQRVGENAKSLREEIIPVIEKRYGLLAEWRGRAFAGVSGGGTAALLIEAQTSGYAHLISAAVNHNSLMNELFFREMDRRPARASRPKVIAIAGENDSFKNVEFTREFARLAQERGMLQELTIHNFGHSGGPRFLVQAMEAAYGV